LIGLNIQNNLKTKWISSSNEDPCQTRESLTSRTPRHESHTSAKIHIKIDLVFE